MGYKSNAISLSNLSKSFGKGGENFPALKDVSFDVKRGESVGLLGPNGSGKSTLVKIINSLVEPTSGRIELNGCTVNKNNQRHLRDIGTLLEGRAGVNIRLSCEENAKYYCALKRCKFDRIYLSELANILDFSHLRKPVRMLSTGNKIRVALLVAVIHKPNLIFMDEPTLGLDVEGVKSLMKLLKILISEGRTLFVSSHDFEFLERITKRIICLHKGRIAYDGSFFEMAKANYAFMAKIDFNDEINKQQELPNLSQFMHDPEEDIFFLKTYEELKKFLDSIEPHRNFISKINLSNFMLKESYLSFLKKQA